VIKEQGAKSKEQGAKSKEQGAKSKEQRARSKEYKNAAWKTHEKRIPSFYA
jgi:hypothetical protein